MKRNQVVLVDTSDREVGVMDKMEAHRTGALHRAFSIFLLNSKGQMLIHQRAVGKYHGAGLWTNACCSHPQPGEDVKTSAMERLRFEMGLQCDIEKLFSFVYRASVENNLIEHEYDHVFLGYSDAIPQPHTDEVHQYRWIYPTELVEEIQRHPETFTFWFREAIHRVLEEIDKKVKAD
jgi:isopentenyl-diphosphate delta-isomerase